MASLKSMLNNEAIPIRCMHYLQNKKINIVALALFIAVTSIVTTGIVFAENIRSNARVTKTRLPYNHVLGAELTNALRADFDKDGLYDWQEFDYGTDPYNNDTDGDGYLDGVEMQYGYDPTGVGKPYMDVVIPKIDTIAPISHPASRAESDVQAAMERGVAFYPGTAVPSQPGSTYLTGHSSDYVWRPGYFKRVFRPLHQLETGDNAYIRVTLANGKVITHTYEVYDKQVTPVNDQRLWYSDREGSVLTLVTSWPLDSTKERLMVRGVLVKTN